MSTTEDMAQCELRDSFGNPARCLINGPVANVRAPLNGNIDQRTDNSTNKPLPWVALACMAGGMGFAGALVLAIALCVGGPIYVQAEVGRAKAEVRQEFNRDIERMQAEVDVAKYEASISKNTVQKLEARLNANERK